MKGAFMCGQLWCVPERDAALLLAERLWRARAEPLVDAELPWVAASATPPPPASAITAASVARVVRLNTVPPFG